MAAVKMTEGGIPGHLIRYSIPLILGNLFQLTYNAFDSVIVGRFIGKETLAAVGTANPVMNIVILGISGICVGSSVLMSRFFGAGEEKKLKKELATTVVFGIIFSLVIALLGIICAEPLLRLLKVPEEIMEIAVIYLKIIFLGAPFTYLYNALAAALKSVGDARTPLKFLALASVLNAALDWALIGGLRFGIVCSAVTTVAAQAVSVLLCIRYIYRRIPELSLHREEFRLDRELLGETIRYGSVTALQQACQPVGKLLIQGAVNTMGVDAIAAFNAAGKIDDYAFIPQQNISNAVTVFASQNKGAGRTDRMKQGFSFGFFLEFCYGLLVCAAVYLGRELLMEAFVGSDADTDAVILLGSSYMAKMAAFYLLPSFTNGVQGCFRGMGRLKITLFGTSLQTSIRVLMVYLLVPVLGLSGVAYACAAGWSIMLLAEVPYFLLCVRRLNEKQKNCL